MPNRRTQAGGCLDFALICLLLGGGWWFTQRDNSQPLTVTISRIFQALEASYSVFEPPDVSPAAVTPPSTFPYPQSVPAGTTITLQGSNPTIPTDRAVQVAFHQAFPNTVIALQNSSSGSLQDLLEGKVDIVAIARPLSDAEKKLRLAALPIRQEAIALIVSIDHPLRRSLTQNQVKAIFSGQITNWSAVRGENLPIKVIQRPTTSPTRSLFQTLVMGGQVIAPLRNSTTLERDGTVLTIRALGNNGISYALYDQVSQQSKVRIVPIDGLVPEAENYPYRQTVYYVYLNPPSPKVQAFLGYVTSSQGQAAIEREQFNAQVAIASPPAPSSPQPVAVAAHSQPSPAQSPLPLPPKTPWQKKTLRGIYLSRYQITNNASEQTIRERVRYYRSQGFNTLIHGVWGNGCTMYHSQALHNHLGFASCPNQFRDRWLDWLIDEAHQQGMEVHAYFEKGIKIDKNSPIFDRAQAKGWLVPGVDKTYAGIDHYVLDVEVPEVAALFREVLVEFVQKYPHIDAVQWDDYLGYHAELPGQVDRTQNLTKFLQTAIAAMKKANPQVSFDLCHHNPYWAKRYFAADWEKWNVDRVFIQAYNEKNFKEELNYAQRYAGIAITDRQFHRLQDLARNPKIDSVLIFPLAGNPEQTAANLTKILQK
jgi:ABC-type phosphate transport system substrate-binding protein